MGLWGGQCQAQSRSVNISSVAVVIRARPPPPPARSPERHAFSPAQLCPIVDVVLGLVNDQLGLVNCKFFCFVSVGPTATSA